MIVKKEDNDWNNNENIKDIVNEIKIKKIKMKINKIKIKCNILCAIKFKNMINIKMQDLI